MAKSSPRTKRKTARKKTVSRKKTTRTKTISEKATSKKTGKKSTAKKIVKKKTISKADSAAKKSLVSILEKILKNLEKIKKQESKNQMQFDKLQKKAFSTKNDTLKLKYVFELEGLKIESFRLLESHYRGLADLLNKAYKDAFKIGGLIRDDYLNVCQDLSKGLNLVDMERDLRKMHRDLS